MNQIFRLSGSVKRDPAISAWMNERSRELGGLRQHDRLDEFYQIPDGLEP